MMGYRSCVALTVYGTPEKVDMVDAMLLQTLSPEYDQGMFEATKQVQDYEDGERCILWTFDDIKWYSEFDKYKDDVLNWVNQMVDAEPVRKVAVITGGSRGIGRGFPAAPSRQ